VNELEKHLHEVINPCWDYAGRCKDRNGEIVNAAMGLAGEAGETADQIKKMLFHTEKPESFHREKLVQELGDVFFYATKLMDLFNIPLDEVLVANRAKLMSRHPELGAVEERFADGYIK
jgi:NTP pyrophosphatase (non-canonical NTP hydrolase)